MFDTVLENHFLASKGYVTKTRVAALGYLEGLCTKSQKCHQRQLVVIKVNPTLGDAAQKLREARRRKKRKLVKSPSRIIFRGLRPARFARSNYQRSL